MVVNPPWPHLRQSQGCPCCPQATPAKAPAEGSHRCERSRSCASCFLSQLRNFVKQMERRTAVSHRHLFSP
jgi:hypothetical protein